MSALECDQLMTSEINDRLQAVFRLVFHLNETADVIEVCRDTEPHWDSLAHVLLVAAIESEFNVSLDAAEMLQLTSYKIAEGLLQAKGL